MSDQPGGLWRVRKLGATVDANALGSNRPLMLVILIGLALAIIPTVSFFLPSQFLSDAGKNAAPLIVGILIAPLIISMLIAIIEDTVSGKGSLLATFRQLGAVLLVVGCIILATLVMQQPDVLTVGGGTLLIGFAIGVGLVFASGEAATYTDASLAMLGWSAFTIPALLGLIVYIITYRPDPSSSPRCLTCGALVGPIEDAICCGAFAVALLVGISSVPLGGIVGGWLRRGYR